MIIVDMVLYEIVLI